MKEAAGLARRAAWRARRPVLPARAGAARASAASRGSHRRTSPRSLDALRTLAAEPPPVSLAHMALRFPPVAQFVERFRALLRAGARLRLRRRGGRR